MDAAPRNLALLFALVIAASPGQQASAPGAPDRNREAAREYFSPSDGPASSRLVAQQCIPVFTTPASAIDAHRSLFVHDRSTLDAADFTLLRTLRQIAGQVAAVSPGITATWIFRQFWDTQATAAEGVTTGPHCDDQGGLVNGFPMACHPGAAEEARGTDAEIGSRMQQYRPIALVNRLDLAREGWQDCGEYRIIYGKYQGLVPGTGGKADIDIIFEAVLPNPKPGCRDGCMPVARFWKSLSTIPDPVVRGKLLGEFFYSGLPGFRPVVHVDHYSASGLYSRLGSSRGGQIRTNYYFMKEFRTAIDCGSTPCQYRTLPMAVQGNPFPPLWNEDTANGTGVWGARAKRFQTDVLAQKSLLGSGNLMEINYSVRLEDDAADSDNDHIYAWDIGFYNSFKAAHGSASGFRVGLPTGALTAEQMVRRAASQSCNGCHSPRVNVNGNTGIGPVMLPSGQTTQLWPDALEAFTHVEANITSPPQLAEAVFGDGRGHRLSPALLDVFLLNRQQFLLKQLNAPDCVCQNKFGFLNDKLALKARTIQDFERRTFASRFEALAGKIRTNASMPEADSRRQELEREAAELRAVFEAEVRKKLMKAGVMMPVFDPTDLRPQPLRLDAARLSGGDRRREEELRVEEVLNLLRNQTPWRSVTGSFRVH